MKEAGELERTRIGPSVKKELHVRLDIKYNKNKKKIELVTSGEWLRGISVWRRKPSGGGRRVTKAAAG